MNTVKIVLKDYVLQEGEVVLARIFRTDNYNVDFRDPEDYYMSVVGPTEDRRVSPSGQGYTITDPDGFVLAFI